MRSLPPSSAPAARPSADRRALLALPLLSLIGFAAPALRAATRRTPVEVWKSPTCGCCKDWIRILQTEGFDVSVHDDGNDVARERLGMPIAYGSCHTARVEGYVLEGHVPPAAIRRLLRERPPVLGLAVPGMPRGSAGMDGPAYGGVRDPYDVLLVQRDGRAQVFQSHR